MSTPRVLILSNARPSRAWNFAERITRELEDIEICGIVQAVTQDLPIEQQCIMGVRSSTDGSPSGRFRKPLSMLRSIWESAVGAALSIIHRHTGNMDGAKFTPRDLVQLCRTKNITVLTAENRDELKIASFVVDQNPDFAIALGPHPLSQELLRVPRCGWISTGQSVAQQGRSNEPAGIRITVEWFGTDSGATTLARVTLPQQQYDDAISTSLKADLLCDDLGVESLKHLLARTVTEAATELTACIQQLFSPYLEQLQSTSIEAPEVGPTFRHRPKWKLCLDTLLLCSPPMIARNWYRKIRRNYPVTILTHHLVSDRPHRMGISTQAFWRQVRFLQRHYRIVSLAEAVRLLKNGQVDAPTIVLTFDDGYADNFLALRAVADEARIPIALFLATEPISLQQEFQHDVGNGVRGALPLTWEQLRYWGSGRTEFGAHTRTHFDCGSKEHSRLESEIAGSKLDLEERLQRPVKFFAFPFGQPENMSAEAIQIARAHFPYFVSGFGGQNHSGRSDRQHLLRKNLYANSWELELELQGVFDIVDRIKKSVCLHNRKSEGAFERVPGCPSQKDPLPAFQKS